MKEKPLFNMLKKQDLNKIRKELEDSVNPLFLFDNDPDGFCSAVILLKNLNKGKALPIKSFPDFDNMMKEKILDFSPDKLFILDKPYKNPEFFSEMNEKGIQVFVIDHHEIKDIEKNSENIFSSYPSSEPTSYICQKIFERKNTEWISIVGCIYDVFIPDFAKDFQEKYPELLNSQAEVSKVRYSSDIGKITLILSLALKSSNQTIQNLIDLFLESESPVDILIENDKNKFIHRRYNFLNKIIQKNTEKAKIGVKLVFLEYSGEYSLSSDIANYLYFLNPDKFIVVCYKKYESINISIRGEKAKQFTEKVVENLERSTGGGHEVACGLRIPYDQFKKFKEMVFEGFE